MDSDWVVVGNGPSHDRWRDFPGRLVACTNSSIIPGASLYVAADPMALKLYADRAKAAIPVCLLGPDARRGLPRMCEPCRTAGMVAIHHAIVRGAKDIVLCGVDGWPPDQMEYKRGPRTCSREGSNENAAIWLARFSEDAVISFAEPGPLWELAKDFCRLAEQGKH